MGSAGSLGCGAGLAHRDRAGSKVTLNTAFLLGSVTTQGHGLTAEQHGEPLPLALEAPLRSRRPLC